MCGEHRHSVDYSMLQEAMSAEAKDSLARAEAIFAEMVEKGQIFVNRKPTPIRIEDLGGF